MFGIIEHHYKFSNKLFGSYFYRDPSLKNAFVGVNYAISAMNNCFCLGQNWVKPNENGSLVSGTVAIISGVLILRLAETEG